MQTLRGLKIMLEKKKKDWLKQLIQLIERGRWVLEQWASILISKVKVFRFKAYSQLAITMSCFRTSKIGQWKPPEDLQKNMGKGVSVRNIRTALKNLEKYGFLTNKSTKTGRLITVVKYCKYHSMMMKTDKDSDNLVTKTRQRGDKEVTIDNKDNKEKKDNKYFSKDSNEYLLAGHLLTEIRKNNENYKQPNLQDWAKNIDLMMRVDNRSPQKIQEVIEWCQQDDFWHPNILSTKKLRDKFDVLVAKMNGIPKEPKGRTLKYVN